MDFFWKLATLILTMLLGHWIEMKSIAGASRELELAAGVFYKAGILLSPAAGAVLMSVSTVIVAVNAGLLKVKNS
jgi:cation transport ATPase